MTEGSAGATGTAEGAELIVHAGCFSWTRQTKVKGMWCIAVSATTARD